MPPAHRRTARRLSVLVALLMVLASGTGLIFPDLHRANALVASSWYGSDLITLFVATPLLVGGVVAARRGSRRGVLVWMGMLAYPLYNYAFSLFGVAFNSLFLLYTALFTFSAFALVFGLVSLDADDLYERVQSDLPARWIGGWPWPWAASTSPYRSSTSLLDRFLPSSTRSGCTRI